VRRAGGIAVRVMIHGRVYDTEKAEKIAELGWATLMRGEQLYFLVRLTGDVTSLNTEEAFNYYQTAVKGVGWSAKGYAVYMDEKAAFGEVKEA